MVDIQLLQTVSIAIASAGVFVAAVYYILQLRHQTKVRQTDLVMRLYSTFGSKDFQEAYRELFEMEFKDYDDFLKKRKDKRLHEVGILFEGIGILLHRKLVDIGLVDDLFSGVVKVTWEKIKPIAEGDRKKYNWPQMYKWFEYLYDEMKKREQQQALKKI